MDKVAMFAGTGLAYAVGFVAAYGLPGVLLVVVSVAFVANAFTLSSTLLT